MNLAVMQPYIFPYIGYFQLIYASDLFVFYDDVNFIKNGWINRNRILVQGHDHYLTVQLKGASPFKLIKDVEFTDNRPKLLMTIEQAYKKAPFYHDVMPVLTNILTYNTEKISELAIYSVIEACKYLGVERKFEISSIDYPQTKELQREDRLLEICKLNHAKTYINPIGGQELYSKESFMKKGNIELFFIKTEFIPYTQFKNDFIQGLSIVDIMMFNSVDKINEMLNKYELI